MSHISPKTISFAEAIQILQEKNLLLEHKQKTSAATLTLDICLDSRKLNEKSTFLCYKGVLTDSHTFIPDALTKKVSCFIIDDGAWFDRLSGENALLVKDGRAAWSALIAFSFDHPERKIELIGITGTNGKTSIAFLTCQMLTLLGFKTANIGTLGFFADDYFEPASHTTPDPPQLYEQIAKAVGMNCKILAMEVSSQALAHERLLGLSFAATCFASFSRDHLDFHKTTEHYFASKMRLFTERRQKGGLALFNGKLPAQAFTQTLPSETLIYGNSKNALPKDIAQIQIKRRQSSLSGAHIEFWAHGKGYKGVIPFFGVHNCENFLAAFLLCYQVVGQEFKPELWHKLKAPPGRLERIKLENSDKMPAVFVDYAHSPDALAKVLKTLKPMCQGQLILVFGCGGDRDRGKRPLMAKVAEEHCDLCYVTTDNPRFEEQDQIFQEIVSGFSKGYSYELISDRKEAIEKSISQAQADDIILIAGKGHENYQMIKEKKLPFSDQLVALAALKALSLT